MSFRDAYKLSAKLVNFAEKNNKKLSELNIKELKKIKKNLSIDSLKVLNIINAANSKTSYGGTAPRNIKKMLNKYKKKYYV